MLFALDQSVQCKYEMNDVYFNYAFSNCVGFGMSVCKRDSTIEEHYKDLGFYDLLKSLPLIVIGWDP